MEHSEMERLTSHTDVKAEKIRVLFGKDVERAKIARFLDISYQHVHNVLKRSGMLDEGAKATPGKDSEYYTVTVGKGNRIVLPEHFVSGEALGEGDVLVCRAEGRGLLLMSRSAAMESLRETARKRMPEEAALLEALLSDGSKASG